MEPHHALERLELRIFVDEHRIQTHGGSGDKRIGEREVMRRFELGRLATQRLVRMVPCHRLLFHRFKQFSGFVGTELLVVMYSISVSVTNEAWRAACPSIASRKYISTSSAPGSSCDHAKNAEVSSKTPLTTSPLLGSLRQ